MNQNFLESSLITRDQSQRTLINRFNFQIQLDQSQSVSFDQSSSNQCHSVQII